MSQTYDTRIPSPEACVVKAMLQKWAAVQPEKVFVKLSADEEVTYRQMHDLAASTAAGLHRLGVRQGDTVIVWLPNSVDCLRVWFGINWLGATYVPINTAYKGALLEHVLKNAGSEIIIAHANLAELLKDVKTANLKTVVVIGNERPMIDGLDVQGAEVLSGSGDSQTLPEITIVPWDLQSIIYTSGTTGPSKGVMTSYAQLYAMSGPEGFYMLAGDDRYMCNLPLFHVGGTIPVMGMLSRGGSISLESRFRPKSSGQRSARQKRRSFCCSAR